MDKTNGNTFHLYRLDTETPLVKLHDGMKMHPVSRHELLSYAKLRRAVFEDSGRWWPDKCTDWTELLRQAKKFPQMHLLAHAARTIRADWLVSDDEFDQWRVPLSDDQYIGTLGFPNLCRQLFGLDPDLDALVKELESEAISFERSEFLWILHVEWLALVKDK